MLRTVFKTWAFIGLAIFLTACGGGDDIQGFTDYTDLRLSQLEISGGTLLFDEVEVERFDPANLGPYTIEFDSDEVTSFNVTASAVVPNSVRLRLVETQKESDGSNRITKFNSGDSVPVSIDEGNSLVYIEVVSRSTGGALRYNLVFNRVSSSAALSDVQIFGVRSYQESSNVKFSEEVKADVFSYDVNLSYQACSTSFIPYAFNQFSKVTVNGDPVDFNEVIFLDLDVGSNIVNVEVTSEDEENTENYVFDLIRAEPTAKDLAEDAYLTSLTFSGGRVLPDFRCNASELNITLGSEDDVIEMVATANQEDAEILISPLAFNSSRGIWQLVEVEDTRELASGETYAGPLLSDLERGTTNIGVRVLSSDGSEAHLYRLIITRIDQRLVIVDTAAELQNALRNAEPNDRINIAEGEYFGETSDSMSDAGSGDPFAHFFSNASGTSDGETQTPIVLFGEGKGAVLIGDNVAENSVLKIQGGNWTLNNIKVMDSGKGVEIVDATDVQMNFIAAENTMDASVYVENSSGITLNGVVISDVQNIAVTFSGTSQSNLTNFSIKNVTGQAIVVADGSNNVVIKNGDINGAGEDLSAEAILVGAGEGASNGNRIEYVNFGRNIAKEAIVLTENANNTYIQSNHFYSDNTAFSPEADRRLIRADGGNITINRNEFKLDSYDGGTDDFESIVNVNIGDGFIANIYDNLLTFDDETVPFINVESASSVNVISNVHSSGAIPINVGDVQILPALPVFQIQSTVDNSRCFQYDTVLIEYESGTSIELDMVTLKPCEDVAEQRWVLNRDFENYVTISPEGLLGLKMSYASFVFTYINEDVEEGEDPEQTFVDRFLYLREDDGSILDRQFSLRWKVENFGDGTMLIQNKNDATARIVESPLDPQEVEEELLFVRGRLSDESNRFTLVPL